MSIFNYYRHLSLSDGQSNALKKIQGFIEDESKQIFILKGYAGSGKTTLIQGLVQYLRDNDKQISITAPTGRAAKILRDKVKIGSTIHRQVYNFDKLESIEIENIDPSIKSFHYYFPVELNTHEKIYIVDEASMISNNFSKHELFTFGTGQLLNDLLSHVRIGDTSSKILFVGDPAQLLPVTDSDSLALSEKFFKGKSLNVESTEITEVARQNSNSQILKNSKLYRDLLSIESNQRNELNLITNINEVIELNPEEIAETYVSIFPTPQLGNGVVIAYSNAQCLEYNQSIREKIFDSKDIVVGDIIMINNNNYHTYGVELFNGDMAQVVDVSKETESLSAPVWIKSKNERKTISLTFRDIIIRVPNHPDTIKCKIIDSLLNDPRRDLDVDEMKAIYINFVIRFKNEQNKRREQGLAIIKEGSADFKLMLRNDLYFNALRVKYGYSITCHKSQGGEWNTVFVDFKGKISLKNEPLRWSYTAITRAKNKLFVINPPNLGVLDGLNFSNTITRVKKIPRNTTAFKDIKETPYHTLATNPAKRFKYFELVEKLTKSGYIDSLVQVNSQDYRETYEFHIESDTYKITSTHNAAGIFSDFSCSTQNSTSQDLIEVLNSPYYSNLQQYNISYRPYSKELKRLYSAMQVACSELLIPITNVEERVDNHFVKYYLKTSGRCSWIQFYFSNNGAFGTALLFSDCGEEDVLLKELKDRLC